MKSQPTNEDDINDAKIPEKFIRKILFATKQ